MTVQSGNIVYNAKFHPVLIKYFLIYIAIILLTTVVGIILIPFWFIGIGSYLCKRYYSSLECTLKEQTLEMKRGYIFRTEKTIPLNKIQDITLKEGPLERAFNTCILQIETAGQATQQGQSDMRLVGIVDARDFRDRVLAQRDKVSGGEKVSVTDNNEILIEIIKEIRDTLHKIEQKS